MFNKNVVFVCLINFVFDNEMQCNALLKSQLFLQIVESFNTAVFSLLYQAIIIKWHHAVVIEDCHKELYC